MKIKRIALNKFKRFADLEITGIPEAAKLIILVGPNGSGKTSLFESLNHWYQLNAFGQPGSQDYIEKKGESSTERNWYQNRVTIEFHNEAQVSGHDARGKFYFRTAYRNEPDFTVRNLNSQSDPTVQAKLSNLMLNDQTVSENYQRLVAQTLAGVYEPSNDDKSVLQLRDELIGKIKVSLSIVDPDIKTMV